MEKIKSFFSKIGPWFKKTFSALWKWCLANKVTAGIIAGAAVLAITTAIVVPVSVSAAKRKGNQEDESAQTQVEPAHSHTFSDSWSISDSKHWHASTCGHDVKKDEGDHTFSNWTQNEDDLTKDSRSCTVCGKTEERSHEHYFSSTWSYDHIHHWHEAACSHTVEKEDYEEHITPTTKIGTYVNDSGSKYDVYKDVCTCGLLEYKIYDYDASSPAYLVVLDSTLPTTTSTGSITFYPDCKSYDTELTISMVGVNRAITYYGDVYVDRAYNNSIVGTKFYASVNPAAYNIPTVDDDNYYMAIALSQDPDWVFEISEAIYDSTHKVVGGSWYEEPWTSAGGTYSLILDNGDHVEIGTSAINAGVDWESDIFFKSDYSDGYTQYYAAENASFFDLIDDVYLREQARSLLCYDSDSMIYDFDKTYDYATYCGVTLDGIAEWDDDSKTMFVVGQIAYGRLNTGNKLYYYTDFNAVGTGKGDPLFASVSSIMQYNEGSSPSIISTPVYGVGTGSFVIGLQGTGLDEDKVNLFNNSIKDNYLSTGGKTQLAHLYEEMLGLS